MEVFVYQWATYEMYNVLMLFKVQYSNFLLSFNCIKLKFHKLHVWKRISEKNTYV